MNSNKYGHSKDGTIEAKRNVTFDQVGGLQKQITCLREMVLLPLMYPKIFEELKIHPPRGILFYGPPGTGKTLLARALINELYHDGKRVTFLSRKGADCLSQWVGESERHLIELFEEARARRPTVIFFDEIDGLAPSRSSRQDHIHASIVSTLLAQMDGLDQRGEVMVIGATNRVDALDPALRRPGRFDRELHFPLPDTEGRYEILKVHTAKWHKTTKDSILRDLAERTRGSCGADLEALCVEAALSALKRCYPQIYQTRKKLCVDPNSITVTPCDFTKALHTLVPAYHRIVTCPARPLPSYLDPLLVLKIKSFETELRQYFPQGFFHNRSRSVHKLCEEYRVLLAGPEDCGQTSYIAPALFNQMECQIFSLTPSSLHENSSLTPEDACVQIFKEAKRAAPSVIYIPDIWTFWDQANDSLRSVIESTVNSLQLNSSVLIFATAQGDYEELPVIIKHFFVRHLHKVMTTILPSDGERRCFFQQLYREATKTPPEPKGVHFISESCPVLKESEPIYSLRGRDVEAHEPGGLRSSKKITNCNKSTGNKSLDFKGSTSGPHEISKKRTASESLSCSCHESLNKRLCVEGGGSHNCSSWSSLTSHSSVESEPDDQSTKRQHKVKINKVKLQLIFNNCVKLTRNQTIRQVINLYQQLLNRCEAYYKLLNREHLIQDFEEEISKYKKSLQNGV